MLKFGNYSMHNIIIDDTFFFRLINYIIIIIRVHSVFKAFPKSEIILVMLLIRNMFSTQNVSKILCLFLEMSFLIICIVFFLYDLLLTGFTDLRKYKFNMKRNSRNIYNTRLIILYKIHESLSLLFFSLMLFSKRFSYLEK